MRRKQVWRYYCEHCKRGSCNPSAMKRHEIGCTNNPARVCKLCSEGGVGPNDVADLVAFFRGTEGQDPQERLKALREKTEGCPACILATLRQSGSLGYTIDAEGECHGIDWGFNFQTEKTAWWSEINANHREHQSYGY